MNEQSTGLIIFALIALAAVFAFIFVLGGPESEKTGQLAGTQKIGTSYFKYRTAEEACSKATNCQVGLPAVPTGRFDPYIGAYECRCVTALRETGWRSDQNFYFWRSPYGPYG